MGLRQECLPRLLLRATMQSRRRWAVATPRRENRVRRAGAPSVLRVRLDHRRGAEIERDSERGHWGQRKAFCNDADADSL